MNDFRKYFFVTICGFVFTISAAQSLPEKVDFLQFPDSAKFSTKALKETKPGIPDSLATKLHTAEFPIKVVNDIQIRKTDSLLTCLISRIDSLSKLPNPDKELIERLSVYRNHLESLRTPQAMDRLADESQSTMAEVDKALSGVEGKVNEKLGLFSGHGANLPGPLSFGVPNEGSTPGLAGMPSPSLSGGFSFPGAKIPSANIPQVTLPDATGVTVPSMPDLRSSLPELGNAKGEMGKMKGVIQEAGGYKKDLKAVTSGNPDSLDAASIEERVEQFEIVSDAGDQFLDGAQQVALVKKWQSDQAYKRELAVTQAKEFAVNHFAGHESELLAVMDQLAQARTKIKDIEQVVDLFEKPANPMKDKPFIERLRPGVNLQLQWNNIVILDINPYVGYRLSARWTCGIGWNERVGFSSDSYSFSSRDRVYGPRAFVHFKFKESNFLILAPELMHAVVPGHTVPTGESTIKWVPGLMGGYRREFRYSKRVIGTVQFLYNIVAPTGQFPYASRFNVLFGFEFPLKKKPKSV